MRRIRSKGTKPELMVRRIVHKMGFRFRLHKAELPGKPDLVFSSLRKIIEVRGCFWHQHAGCNEAHIPKSSVAYWEPKLTRNVARDADNGRKLTELGWRVLILWECEVSDDAALSKKIRAFLTR